MQTLNFLIISIDSLALAMYACNVLPDIMSKEHKHDVFTKTSTVTIGILLIMLTCLAAVNTNKFDKYILKQPTAMDVYSGKTELRYSVQGDEIIDSVVVYKNNQN